jgi:hypothetical protein
MKERKIKKEWVDNLHKHFIRFDKMRIEFYRCLDLQKEIIINSREAKFNDIEMDMYLELWYALTCVVIEGWKKLDLHDEKIDKLLLNPNVKLLFEYRHSVVHYREKYNDKRQDDFYKREDCVEWIRNLREEYSRWFLEYFKV